MSLSLLGFTMQFETYNRDGVPFAALWVRFGRRSAWIERTGLRLSATSSAATH